MRGRIVVAALALVAAMVAAAAPVAHAASGAELTEASGAAFPAKTFVLTLPDRRDLRPNDVSVSENGQDVEGLRIVPGDAAGTKTFGTVLVIDTSQSMRGAPIAAAMAAARRFAEQRPAQQRLGVVFFNREATVALRPTTDAARIAAVLASPPQLAKGTRIYDSTALAMRVLRDAKVSAGSVVLLSDGADVGSNLKPGAVADAARHAKTRIFSVGLRSRSYDGSTLRDLATSAGGRYAEADEHQLAQLFSGLGRRFGREYLITYRSLAPLSTHVQVQARVAGVSGAALVTYTSPAFRAVTDAKGASRSAFMGSNASLALAAGLVALLIGLAAFLVLRSGRRTVHARIADFTRRRLVGPCCGRRRRVWRRPGHLDAPASGYAVASLGRVRRGCRRGRPVAVAGTHRALDRRRHGTRRPRRDRARQPDPRGACSGRAGDRPRGCVGRRVPRAPRVR